MARYFPGMGGIQAGFPLLDSGDYTFEVGEPKVFNNPKENKETGADETNFGVGFNLNVTSDGKFNGQSIGLQRMYVHTEGASKMSKGFAMAVLGFNPLDKASEKLFNDKYNLNSPEAEDWVDVESNECGQMWKDCAGRMVNANVSIKANTFKKDGSEQNNFRWMSFSS